MLETRAWCYSRWARPAPELQGSDTAPRPVPRGAQALGTAAPCPNLAPGCSPHPKTQRERALRPDPSAPTPRHPDRLRVLCRRVRAAGWGRGASPPPSPVSHPRWARVAPCGAVVLAKSCALGQVGGSGLVHGWGWEMALELGGHLHPAHSQLLSLQGGGKQGRGCPAGSLRDGGCGGPASLAAAVGGSRGGKILKLFFFFSNFFFFF